MVTLQKVTAAASVAFAVRDMVVSRKGLDGNFPLCYLQTVNTYTYTIIYTRINRIVRYEDSLIASPFRSSVGREMVRYLSPS